MLFNSIEFTIFLPLVFGLYWLLNKCQIKYQNLLLLAASYFFYGWWDWRFLGLVAFSSLVDFYIGILLGKEENLRRRKLLLITSLLVNLGFLGFFKYFNFFLDNFIAAFTLFGSTFEISRLEIILPIGISFYTFQTLSYSLDVYYKEIEPTKDPIAFFAFVSFFPQLVAGPIERATNLLPQFFTKRQFDYAKASDGMRQILWGFFKKVVIADNCAVLVNDIFANHSTYSSTTLLLGGIYVMIQIYCDFSGYSDIAIGTARLFGFNLMQNFNNPYFSTNTTELWRRWHISLSTWFRDYIFTPLLLHYRNLRKKAIYVATFLTFLLLGIWHGANWTFFVFGLCQSIVLCMEIYTKKRRNKLKKVKRIPLKFYFFVSWILTMLFWMVVSILFRSESVGDAYHYFADFFFTTNIAVPEEQLSLWVWLGVVALFGIEWINKDYEHGLKKINIHPILKYAFYFILFNCILSNLVNDTPFVYFQF